MQLRRAGWTFGQIGQGFVVHYPHLDSPARQAWNGDPSGEFRPSKMMQRPSDDSVLRNTERALNDELFVEFRDWLDEQYQLDGIDTEANGIRTPLCEDANDDNAKLWVSREH